MDLKRSVRYPPEWIPEVGLATLPKDERVKILNVKAPSTETPFTVGYLRYLYISRWEESRLYFTADGMTIYDTRISGAGYPSGLSIGFFDRLMIEAHNMSEYDADVRFATVVCAQPVSILQKILLGREGELTDEERALAEGYGLYNWLAFNVPPPPDNKEGVTFIREVTDKVEKSTEVLRVTCPPDHKLVILGVAAQPADEPGMATLSFFRDEESEACASLDLFGMPGLDYVVPMRLVSLEGFKAVLDVTSGGPYFVRIFYGLGRLNLVDKVRWKLTLTEDERKTVEETKLDEMIRVGIIKIKAPAKAPPPTPTPPVPG